MASGGMEGSQITRQLLIDLFAQSVCGVTEVDDNHVEIFFKTPVEKWQIKWRRATASESSGRH